MVARKPRQSWDHANRCWCLQAPQKGQLLGFCWSSSPQVDLIMITHQGKQTPWHPRISGCTSLAPYAVQDEGHDAMRRAAAQTWWTAVCVSRVLASFAVVQ